MQENKASFIQDINEALISNGNGRYDHLKQVPLMYVPIVNAETGFLTEYVTQGNHMVNITGDSLTAILEDLHKAKVI